MDDSIASQSFAQRAAVFGLLVYKSVLSPLLPSCCKFHPSCSCYAKQAVESHGVRRGMWLAAKRGSSLPAALPRRLRSGP